MSRMKVPRRRLPWSRCVSREHVLVEACRSRKVLHVGCADAPFTATKFENGTLLHLKLAQVAACLAGVDLDGASIEWLAAHGVGNVHTVEAARLREALPKIGFEPETIIAGEVLEHLAQPLDFLRELRDAMAPDATALLSVPNAFSAASLLHVMLGSEKVHEEHVAYFSYWTIQQFLERADLKAVKIVPYRHEAQGLSGLLERALLAPLLWVWPHLAPGYVVQVARST